MRLRLAEYGRRELLLATLFAFGLCITGAWFSIRVSPWFLILLVLPGCLWVCVVMFFRDPHRSIPADEGLFVSPADGRITDLTQIGPDSMLGSEGVQIGIFMNVFNVHVNRAPCEGRIDSIDYQSGAFLDARDPLASQRNESATIRMRYTHENREHPVLVRQIAGLIARRIVTDVEVDQDLTRGQRIGMIKFGSRVELLVPRELVGRMRVEVGRCVKAGQTVLFQTRKDDAS